MMFQGRGSGFRDVQDTDGSHIKGLLWLGQRTGRKLQVFPEKPIHAWLVVWNMFYFRYFGNDHPNWRTPSFFRGVETTK
jgi:hypothetical protein